MTVEEQVKRLVAYGQIHLGLDEEDATYVTNLMLRELKLVEPFYGEIDVEEIKKMSVPDEFTNWFNDYFVSTCSLSQREAQLKTCFLMGLISPRPSKVNETFYALYEINPKAATDYLYDLSIKNDYVQKTKVDRNIVWDTDFKEGTELEISINLSKPEKNNKDIAKLLSTKSSSYPKCLLCHENLGFEGNEKKDPRETIRFIPLNLGGEKWYLQYSPYGYYDEHCILFYDKHEPMEVSKRIITRLTDFVDQFPHYFVGSNSDLPIVGGSILDHEHFQGGSHLMPVMHAKDREVFKTSKYKNVTVSLLDFYNTVLCIKGASKEEVIEVAATIEQGWRAFSSKEHNIIAKDENGIHNTVTPIVRKVEEGYIIYLILRNNCVNETYPDGIFHAHPEYHMIKKEGIGLIEAMGRFILPARLKRQIAQIEEIVSSNMSKEEYVNKYPDMIDFEGMINTLKETKMDAKTYINNVCRGILKNVGVFKDDEHGKEGLHNFMKGLSL